MKGKLEKTLTPEKLAEAKAAYPKHEYTEDNPPPRDPLEALVLLEKRRNLWFKKYFVDDKEE